VPQREQLTLAASGAIPVGAAVTVTLPDRYLLAGALLLLGLAAALLASAPLRARLEHATLRHLAVRWPA
jgi:hypothetical protein